MKKFSLFLCVISAMIKWSMCNSDYGIDEHITSGSAGSAQFCSDLNPQNHLDISQVLVDFGLLAVPLSETFLFFNLYF